MRVLISLVFVLCSFGFVSAQEAFLGDWKGAIAPDLLDLGIGITFENSDGDVQARITIPVQGFEDELIIEEITENTVRMRIASVPASFDGTLSGDTLEGTFKQNGQELPFKLERSSEALSLVRPQDPADPLPYSSDAVSFNNEDISLAGTLTMPTGDGPFAAVIMITGSGPQDRNEELAGHRPFLVISDALTKAGYAVLRTDDRGVGGSSGDLSESSYNDLASDVIAALDFLKAQPKIDTTHIGLFGHSEGGFIAPLAASKTNDFAFMMIMAGPSATGFEVLELQNKVLFEQDGATEEEVTLQLEYLANLKDALTTEDYDEAKALTQARMKEAFASLDESERPSAATQKAMTDAQLSSVVSPYFRNLVMFDPQPYLASLDIPVLAFYGGLDVQVIAEQNVELMREILVANPDATVTLFDDLNHLMQPAETGALSEYADIEITIAPEVLELITSWMQERF